MSTKLCNTIQVLDFDLISFNFACISTKLDTIYYLLFITFVDVSAYW